MSRLTGKITLVTGASQGIGAGIAKKLGAVVQGDFTKPEEITRTFAAIENRRRMCERRSL